MTQYVSETKLGWKVNIFIVGFKLENFISINKQVFIISITFQSQEKFWFCFPKRNTTFFLW